MDSRRRAELLATLSPEGLATYQVLKAQLARDLDRSFAASKARLEKSVETAFGDLHTKLDETIGRLRQKVRTDDGTRRTPAAAALASSATSSAAFSPVLRGAVSTTSWAAASVQAATATDIPTPSTTAAPSAHTATSTCVPIVAALDSTSPRVQAVTATAPTAPVASVDLNLKRDIDHLISGSAAPTSNPSDVITMFPASTVLVIDQGAVDTDATSTPAPPHANCSTGGLSHHADGEDPVVLPLPPEGAPTSIISPPEHSPSPPLEQSDISKLVTANPLLQPTTCSTECPGGDTSAARAVLSPTAAPGRCSTEGVDEDTSVKLPESALGICLPTIVPPASFHSSLMPLADANLRCTHAEKADMFQLLNNNDNIHVSKEQDKSPLVPCLVHAIATRATSPFQLQYCCENLGMCQHPYFQCCMCAPSPWDPGRQINKLGSLVMNKNYVSIVLWPSRPPDRTELSGMIPSSLLPMDVSLTQSNLFLQDQGTWCEKQYSSCKRMICAEGAQYGLESFPWYIAWLHFGLELLLFGDADYFLAALFPTVPHEGNYCFAISFALHTTSSAENYSQVVVEKWILYWELFAISMFWSYQQKIRTLGLLSSEADFCTVNILFLPRRTTNLKPWPPPYSSNVALQFPSSRPTRVITVVTGILCHISAVIGIDGSEHFLCAVAWLLCDYSFCSSMAADQFCKDANVQEKGRYAECNSTVLHMITIDLMQWKDSLMFINFIFLLAGIPFTLKMVSGKDKFSFSLVPWEIAWTFGLASVKSCFPSSVVTFTALCRHTVEFIYMGACYVVNTCIAVPEFLLAILISSGTSFALDYGEIQAALLANCVTVRSFGVATVNEFIHVPADKLYQCIVQMLQLQWDPGDCFVSVWRHEKLASTHDVCQGPGISTLQATWDPGGSTQYQFVDKAEDWVQEVLRTPWDPGGTMQHRLGGKSNLMGEGLSATRVGLDSGPSLWAWLALTVARRSPTNSRKRETERGLDRNGLAASAEALSLG